MTVQSHTHAYYEEILREHRDLLSIVCRIRDAIAQRRGGKSSLPGMFAELAAHLTSHFAFECEGGYLSEALENAPHMQPQADVLERQHPQLLEAVMQIREQIDVEGESDAWWEHLQQSFEAFSQSLIEHERSENQLVQEALDRDTGARD